MKLTDPNLCIDIGNTRIKLAVFMGNDMLLHEKCKENELLYTLQGIFENHQISRIIVSSTRKGIPEEIRNLQKKVGSYVELDHNTALPIKINYQTPETLGRDRIAAAVGANSLYPDEGNIVVDAGTCVTYDYIDKKSTFQGGNIAPGMYLRLKAMNQFTANLPFPEIKFPEGILGKSTDEALQNGAMRGTIYEIDSFIKEIEIKYGDSRVILTGGDAIYFVDYFKSKIFVVQNLVLIGLNQILKHNA